MPPALNGCPNCKKSPNLVKEPQSERQIDPKGERKTDAIERERERERERKKSSSHDCRNDAVSSHALVVVVVVAASTLNAPTLFA